MPKFLSNLCLKNKIYFTHISTDCVFKGDKGNYRDKSYKDNKEHYGLSKNLGEVNGLNEIDLDGDFTSVQGTYILRLMLDGEVVSRRLTVM